MPTQILLIDDSKADSVLTESLLTDIDRHSYSLDWVDTMRQGLVRVSQPNNYEVILLDYHIGTDLAVDFLTEVREKGIKTPVIVLTGVYDLQKDLAVSKLGAMDFLDKSQLDGRLLERSIRYAIINHEKTKIQQRLTQATEKLIQTEKMASIGQLAAGVAHEINNPAGFVCSNMSMLSKLVAELKGYIEKLRSACETVSSEHERSSLIGILDALSNNYVIDDISDISTESLEGMNRVKSIVLDLKNFCHGGELAVFGPADINRAIKSTLNIINNEVKYHANVESDLSDLPLVTCNIGRINQVFMNILVNAAHAIKKAHRDSKGVIRIRTFAEGDTAYIDIEDNGCGISQKIKTRIFEPFFTTKDVGEGTGLGLSIAYGIVREHGGDIQVMSEEQRGTRFRICLPVSGQV